MPLADIVAVEALQAKQVESGVSAWEAPGHAPAPPGPGSASCPPDLSVIIPSWNTRDILRDCLASIERQRGDLHLEVLVVDNASHDGSADMVRRDFPDVVLIRNVTNRGFAGAVNQGLRAATGRYPLLLNSDTLICGDVLQQTVRYMDNDPEVGAFGCRVLDTAGTTQPTCSAYPTIGHLLLRLTALPKLGFIDGMEMGSWQRDTARDVDVVSGCYLCTRREAVEQVGLLDEDFVFFGEETDWCRRVADAGWKVRFAPVGEIIHLGGASARKLEYRREILLGRGLIRFQRKHCGAVAAAAAWCVLLAFVLTRAIGYAALSVVRPGDDARNRRRLFATVLRNFRWIWPGSKRPML
jgi:GT2 family glycosyltransferase